MVTQEEFERAREESRQRKLQREAELEDARDRSRIRKELAEGDQRGHILDTTTGLLRIAPFVVEETLDLFASIGEAAIIPGIENAILFFKDEVGRRGDDPRTIEIEPESNVFTLNKEELLQFPRKSVLRPIESAAAATKDFIPEPERLSGQTVETIGRFIGGFLGAGKIKWLAKLAGSGKKGFWAASVVKGALADVAVFDGHEKRAANLARDMGVENEFVAWLAADDEDGELEGRLKQAIEGTIFGLSLDSIMLGFRAIKNSKAVRAASDRFKENRKQQKEIEAQIRENEKVDIEEIPDEKVAPEELGFSVEDEGFVQNIDFDPETSRFRVEEVAGGDLSVVAKDSDLEVLFTLRETDDTITVFFSEIDDAAKGLGLGLEMYITAVEYALARGKVFASDETLTRFARNIYKKLKDRGYTVEENRNLTDVGNTTGAPISTLDGKPMFKVTGKQTVSARAAARSTNDLTQAARLSDDVGTVSTRAVGRTSTPEQISVAIERAEIEGTGNLIIDFSSFADDPTSVVKFIRSLERAYERSFKTLDKVTNAETLAKSKEVLSERHGAKTVESLNKMLTEGHGLAAKQVAADQLVINSERNLIKLAKDALGSSASPAKQAALLRAHLLHRVLANDIRGSRREIAQALQAMSILKPERLLDEGIDTIELMRRMDIPGTADDLAKTILKNQNNPAALQELTKRTLRAKIREILLEIFYGNILSAPSTQIVNVMGNMWKVAEDIIFRGGSLGVAGAKSLLTGRGLPKERWFEVVGYLAGLKQVRSELFRVNLGAILKNVKKSGFSLTKMTKLERKVFYQEQDELGNLWKSLLTGDSQTGRASKLAEVGQSGLSVNFDMPDNLKDMVGWERVWKTGINRAIGLPINALGAAVRLPGKAIVGMDEIFKTLANNTQKYSLAYSDAYVQLTATRRPRTGTAVGRLAAEFISDGRYNQGGIDFARAQTYQQELGKLGKWVESGLDKFPAARFIIPFVRTPTNLLKDGLSYTPLQLLNKNMYADLRAGGRAQERAVVKIMMASAFTYEISSLWSEERLKGAGSRTNSEALRGVLRYSIQDDNGTWHRFNRLDPIGMMIGFTADVLDAYAELDLTDQGDTAIEELTEFSTAFGMAFAQNFASKTYLRGIQEFIGVLDQWQRGGTTKAMNFAGTLLANLLPIVGSNFERRRASGQDHFARFAFTTLDEFRSRIPTKGFSAGGALTSGVEAVTGFDLGDRSDLGKRRDALGRPITNTLTMTSVISESKESKRELDLQLADLDFRIPMGGRAISGIKLTSRQYSDWLLIRGQEVKDFGFTLEEQLVREFNDPFFNRLPTLGQQERISSIVRRYSALARKELLRRDKKLAERVLLAKELLDAERKPQRFSPAPPSQIQPQPLDLISQLFPGAAQQN